MNGHRSIKLQSEICKRKRPKKLVVFSCLRQRYNKGKETIMRLKNIISLCVSYLVLIVAIFISSIDQAKGGLQVTGSLVLLIVFTFVLMMLYTPFVIASIFVSRKTSIAVLIFSIFMEIAVMLPLLLNSIFAGSGSDFSRIVMLVFTAINMVVLLFLIINNSIYISKHKNELR